jgi:hypothetical protein
MMNGYLATVVNVPPTTPTPEPGPALLSSRIAVLD